MQEAPTVAVHTHEANLKRKCEDECATKAAAAVALQVQKEEYRKQVDELRAHQKQVE